MNRKHTTGNQMLEFIDQTKAILQPKACNDLAQLGSILPASKAVNSGRPKGLTLLAVLEVIVVACGVHRACREPWFMQGWINAAVSRDLDSWHMRGTVLPAISKPEWLSGVATTNTITTSLPHRHQLIASSLVIQATLQVIYV
eukprot:scaffold328851_cov16-Prasinocladus_malaysianus.AAC.3